MSALSDLGVKRHPSRWALSPVWFRQMGGEGLRAVSTPRAGHRAPAGVCRKACLPRGRSQSGVEAPARAQWARLALPPSFFEVQGWALLPRPSPGLSRVAFPGVGPRLSVWSLPAGHTLLSLSLGSLILPCGFARLVRPCPSLPALSTSSSGPCEPPAAPSWSPRSCLSWSPSFVKLFTS